jgi:hypothetical protein
VPFMTALNLPLSEKDLFNSLSLIYSMDNLFKPSLKLSIMNMTNSLSMMFLFKTILNLIKKSLMNIGNEQLSEKQKKNSIHFLISHK